MSRPIFNLVGAAMLLLLAALSSTQSIAQSNEDNRTSFAPALPGTVVGKHIFGLARDVQNDPLMINEDPLIYDAVDSEVDITVGENLFKLSFFNHQVGGVYISDIDTETNELLDTQALPLGKLGGVHGISSVVKTDWNSVLFSEDLIVNSARSLKTNDIVRFYFKQKRDMVKPYHYGWINEVVVLDEDGNAKGIKNFSAGRTFASHIIAMPDAKTFYLFDTQYSGNAYVFIADEAQSFSKGVLYALSESNSIDAIELGKSSALKMKFKLKKASFKSFFNDEGAVNGVCKGSFSLVKSIYGEECLKIQKKNRKYVGQFEPIRVAALKGVKPFVLDAPEISFDSHNNVIKVTHNDGHVRQYKLNDNAELGTKYFLTK